MANIKIDGIELPHISEEDAMRYARTAPLGHGGVFRQPPKGAARIKDPTLQINFTHLPTKKRIDLDAWVSQFSDQFQSTWSGTPVYGRMDDLYTFQRTGRKISIQFDVVAADVLEAAANQEKLNKIAQFLYPVYSPETVGRGKNQKNLALNQRVIVSPPLLKMGWVNMIENSQELGGLTGFLNGFSYSPTIESGQFFGPTGGRDTFNYQHYSVQLEFTVLHTHLVGWSKDSKGNYVFGGSEEQADVLQNFPHRSGPQTAPPIIEAPPNLWGAREWDSDGTAINPDEVSTGEAAAEESEVGGA
jgi:hypothetical protein